MKILKYSMAFVLPMAVILGCSDSKDNGVAGTVTDTGNTLAFVSGVVTNTDGEYASGATVRMARRVLVKSDSTHVPEYVETQTDSMGAFAFDSSVTVGDTFQLAVIDTVAKEISYLPSTTSGSHDFDSIQLEKAAIFKSVLYYEELPEPAVAVGSHFRVFMPGTPFFQSVFAGDSFSMMIPAGQWMFTFSPGDPQLVSKLQNSEVADSLIYRTWNMAKEVESGDTLAAGPFIWSPNVNVDSIIKAEEKNLEQTSRISGRVYCRSGKACAGVEVQVVTDIYGFGFVDGDSLGFVGQTTTDSDGYWYMPIPEVPYDSFRVEYRLTKNSEAAEAGFSRYVDSSEVNIKNDTLFLGNDTLAKLSSIVSGVNLVIDKNDTNQSNNCMVNSVVVGFKGSSHFVRGVTCNTLEMNELPSGVHELVLYSGDTKVINTLQDAETPLDLYVTLINVELPEGAALSQQWMTYTPPTLK
ncbi:MAG: carboxypeptidase regulatory-like domain-containing protein [Fibrobacter sp.]|nr:carboxypeptidase regulatory-like domain-containing protein [Fibrobacter sp.]